MKPPFCLICDAPCEPDGLLAFRMTDDDAAWKRWSEAGGGTGHPPWQDWFCREHVRGARELTHLTLTEAQERLR